MKRRLHKRSNSPSLTIRETLARNVKAHLDRRFRHLPFLTDRAAAAAKEAGIGVSTVMRIATGRRSASIDTLDRLARALRVPTYALLKRRFR